MKKIKNIIIIVIIASLTLILNIPKVFATNVSISLEATTTTPTVGQSVTVTATAVAGGFNLTLSGNGETKQIVGQTDVTDNVKKTASITFTPTEAKTYTFTLSGDYSDFFDENDTTIKVEGKTISINVKDKETPSTPSTPTEPNFTSANKTMYATGNINLRSSWSTSSSATTISKGTELTVTATSTEKVNGYVWYRVSYNGQTKYVASNLLTSEKPEEPKEEEKPEEKEEEKKSNNANLKSLTIDNHEFSPIFKAETTEYAMEVGNNITELSIKAETEDSKATVSIQGNKNLKDGENVITISVSAEDGTVKIYEIKVTKTEELALGLASLTIEGTDIENTFKPDVYEYEIEVKDITKLNIEAIANNAEATVEILGNEELEDGENFITIIVTSKDEEEKVTYQIKVNKLVEIDETEKTDIKIYVYIVILVVLVIALIIAIVYAIKNKNKEDNNDEYDVFKDDFSEDFEENENNKEIEDVITKEINDDSAFSEERINEDIDLEEERIRKPRTRKGKHSK